MITVIFIIGMIGLLLVVNNVFTQKPQPVKTSSYKPKYIDDDGTIVCVKDIDIYGWKRFKNWGGERSPQFFYIGGKNEKQRKTFN